MTRPLVLERGAELACLETALRRAADGTGSVVLISGEAGIGKTSIVRAFALGRTDRARVLVGACDDLVTPRTLGPLRDAVRAGGPLAAALAGGDRDAVLSALLADLADGPRPTVLVVEDVHWADDATLDVLRYVGRRVADLPVVLVVTYRDEEVGPALQRVLGALGGPTVHRLAPARLSRAAVARMVGGTAATSAPLYLLTAGNPFFVSEMAATGSPATGSAVPATVVDAVLARVQRLGAAERTALEQLSVVPSGLELRLAREVLDDLGVLAGLERTGLLEMRTAAGRPMDGDAVAFRHELARRAVEAALPVATRMQYNARVLAALLREPDPDLARVVHHADAAGDEVVVAVHAPAAARVASRLGAHTQEVALRERALRHRHLLDPAVAASLWQQQAMALFTLDRVPEALEAGRQAVRLYETRGAAKPLAEALVTLALAHWALVQPREALATAERAVGVLGPGGDSRQHAYALAYLAGLQTNVDRDEEAVETAAAALAMARRLDAPDLVALGRIAHGNARHKRGDLGAVDELRAGIDAAAGMSAHVFVMTGYLVMVENLWQQGLLAETARSIAEATAYAEERDVDIYLDSIRAHALRLQAVRGEWEAAEAGLRRLLATSETGGARYSLPELARLLVRRGAEDAAAVVERAVAHTRRADARYQLVPALMARIELAWLTGRPADARAAAAELDARTAVLGAERPRADLLRWLRRLGEPVQPCFPGCPPEYAAGLRGDWRAAARAFAERGAPYAQALELADSGEPEPMLEALRMLDDLGARPAAALLRRRLRERGITQVPRGPTPTTRANPAGLTDRQVEILRLLVAGRTNAEIATTLVLSVRTVDHHVSAVLQKLAITSRREVAGAVTRLGLV